MSAVAILTPVVVAAWPAISAAAVSAAASLGFNLVDQLQLPAGGEITSGERRVELEVPGSEVVTGSLGRAQQIRVARDGVIATFARDARGRATICVTGTDHSEEELRALGEELSGRLVQQFVLQKLRHELEARGMNLVEETVDEHHAVRLRVRHWQN